MFGNKDIGFVLKNIDVVPTFHHLGKTIQRILNFDLSKVETILIITFIFQLIFYVTKTMISSLQQIKSQVYGIQKLEFQTTAVPNYFECLREQDLEELVDEEQMYTYDFRVTNMDPENIQKAEDQL